MNSSQLQTSIEDDGPAPFCRVRMPDDSIFAFAGAVGVVDVMVQEVLDAAYETLFAASAASPALPTATSNDYYLELEAPSAGHEPPWTAANVGPWHPARLIQRRALHTYRLVLKGSSDVQWAPISFDTTIDYDNYPLLTDYVVDARVDNFALGRANHDAIMKHGELREVWCLREDFAKIKGLNPSNPDDGTKQKKKGSGDNDEQPQEDDEEEDDDDNVDEQNDEKRLVKSKKPKKPKSSGYMCVLFEHNNQQQIRCMRKCCVLIDNKWISTKLFISPIKGRTTFASDATTEHGAGKKKKKTTVKGKATYCDSESYAFTIEERSGGWVKLIVSKQADKGASSTTKKKQAADSLSNQRVAMSDSPPPSPFIFSAGDLPVSVAGIVSELRRMYQRPKFANVTNWLDSFIFPELLDARTGRACQGQTIGTVLDCCLSLEGVSLLLGEGRIGKSALCQELCTGWASIMCAEKSIAVYVPLCSRTSEAPESLEKALSDYWIAHDCLNGFNDSETVKNIILQLHHHADVLWIFDEFESANETIVRHLISGAAGELLRMRRVLFSMTQFTRQKYRMPNDPRGWITRGFGMEQLLQIPTNATKWMARNRASGLRRSPSLLLRLQKSYLDCKNDPELHLSSNVVRRLFESFLSDARPCWEQLERLGYASYCLGSVLCADDGWAEQLGFMHYDYAGKLGWADPIMPLFFAASLVSRTISKESFDRWTAELPQHAHEVFWELLAGLMLARNEDWFAVACVRERLSTKRL